MKNRTSIQAILKIALIFSASAIVGCTDTGEDETGDTESGSDTDNPTTTDTTTASTTASTTDTTTASTTATTTVSTTEADTSTTADTSETAESSSTGDDEFIFPEDPYSAYTQIDRHGAVEAGTAGIAASQGLGFNKGSDIAVRDEYNASNPAEDAAMMWVPEIAESVMFFHAALDDDIVGLSLTPASFNESIEQAGPVIIPDTIKYDPSMPTGYPNGRNLEDRVVDITLAAVLIDLGMHSLTTFSDIPLNPGANDVPFEADFPYLAPPHAP